MPHDRRRSRRSTGSARWCAMPCCAASCRVVAVESVLANGIRSVQPDDTRMLRRYSGSVHASSMITASRPSAAALRNSDPTFSLSLTAFEHQHPTRSAQQVGGIDRAGSISGGEHASVHVEPGHRSEHGPVGDHDGPDAGQSSVQRAPPGAGDQHRSESMGAGQQLVERREPLHDEDAMGSPPRLESSACRCIGEVAVVVESGVVGVVDHLHGDQSGPSAQSETRSVEIARSTARSSRKSASATGREYRYPCP